MPQHCEAVPHDAPWPEQLVPLPHTPPVQDSVPQHCPELVQVAMRYDLIDHPRHLVRPGITGLWQVSKSRGNLLHENVHIDVDYVRRVTFVGDCKILLRTFRSVVKVRGS